MAIVELNHVSKIYEMGKVAVTAVNDASFSIEKGDFAAISGPSGSGKSTLLNIIGLIDMPSTPESQVIINGENVYDGVSLSPGATVKRALDNRLTVLRRRNLGFIFQTFNLVPVLNVRENVWLPLTLGATIAGDTMSKSELNDWTDFLIETVGLTEWRNHRPNELSGGQRQRVAIARALVTKAPVILADEPTANLDSKNGDQILELMQKLNRELETTFIFSTHDRKIVDMSNHVIKISDGKILTA